VEKAAAEFAGIDVILEIGHFTLPSSRVGAKLGATEARWNKASHAEPGEIAMHRPGLVPVTGEAQALLSI
jgi:hypothetical protein